MQPEGPYFLGGFCLGAYVALEMARQLEAERQQVALLVSFNTGGVWRTVDSFRRDIGYHFTHLSGLGLQVKAACVVQRVRFRLMRLEHLYGALICKVLLAVGRPLPRSLRDFQAAGAVHLDPRMFWGEVAGDGVEVHVVPGAGQDTFREPNVAVLAQRLRLAIAKGMMRPPGQ